MDAMEKISIIYLNIRLYKTVQSWLRFVDLEFVFENLIAFFELVGLCQNISLSPKKIKCLPILFTKEKKRVCSISRLQKVGMKKLMSKFRGIIVLGFKCWQWSNCTQTFLLISRQLTQPMSDRLDRFISNFGFELDIGLCYKIL